MMVAACSQDVIVEVQNPTADLTRTINVSFEGEDTRIQLNDELKTVWTKDDLVSVFYRSTVNEQWQFQGETGDRSGDIMPVDSSINPPATTNHIVVVYPYNEGYFYNSETRNVQASLPAEQTYLKDSYGLNGNIMISSSEYNQISLKSVCGWLKLQLTGSGEKVKSITLRGNNDEQVAGELYINSSDASSTLASTSNDEVAGGEAGGTLVRPGTILKEVTLNCGDGVELGTEPTAFYIALPPQTFEKGITVEITCSDGTKMIKSSNKVITIVRNHILPMTEVVYSSNIPPSNQIWYTSSNSNTIQPYNTNIFGANIISNTYDSKGVITFDGDVTTIGKSAFYNCKSLTSVNIPDSVTTIGNSAFYGCSVLTSVTIGDSVTTIGEQAFYNCYSLTSVTIPDSVTTIGNSAFYYCNSLTSVTIPDSVTTIGDDAFYYCNSLTSVTIPDSVTTIGDGAFMSCFSLTSVTIPDSVTTIGGQTFYGCSVLTSVTIPDSVTKIEAYAFHYCNSLTSVTIPDGVTTIGAGAFRECKSLTSVTIGDSVTTIGYGAFYNCESLTSVTIPDSVTTIGKDAFGHCESLTSVTIGDSVTTIVDGAFADCYSLTSVTIPDSVTTIGWWAFEYCRSLTSVTIPESVTMIGDWAFAYCTSLTSVYCKATTPPTLDGNHVFDLNDSSRIIYVPASEDDSIINAYKAATGWKEYKAYIYEYDYTNE